jgi:hypothetical protein
MAGNSKDEGKSVVGEVVTILCAFIPNDGLLNAQIARLTGLPVSTAHRLLRELVVGGMLERAPHNQYRIGPNSMHAGNVSSVLNKAASDDCGGAERCRLGHRSGLVGAQPRELQDHHPCGVPVFGGIGTQAWQAAGVIGWAT